tara:strand:- start:3249 stop:3665 length:417 start_codon:yes stop_codon:yes gene_type:complete
MPANTAPIFSIAPDVQWGAILITAANTSKTGTGTVTSVFTADPTNGGYIQRIRFKSAGTNVQTVARVFINNGGDNNTASNNILFDEITLGATTVTETSSLPTFEIPLNFALPPSFRLLITLGTGVAAGYAVSVIGGKY